MYNVFAFDLETCNVEDSEYCEPYAAGVYHAKNLFECFNGDLSEVELDIERSTVHVFKRENINPVSEMIDYVVKHCEGEPKNIFIKHAKRILSSYKCQLVGHNASRFDNYIVLNSLPSSYMCIRIIKTSRGLIKLSFEAASVNEDNEEIP